MFCLSQLFQVILDRVADCARYFRAVGNRHSSTLAIQLKYLYRKFGQVAQDQALTLDLLLQPYLLLLQRAQEECQPWLPVRRFCVNRTLRLAQAEAVRVLVLLSLTLEARGRGSWRSA